jgi:iron(III) transport system permease protein
MVLAIGFYAAYAPPPLALAGTASILVLAFVTRFLPIAYSNASAAIRGVNPEMEEAVMILGGSRLLAIRRVVGPLLKRGLLGAWLLVFIPASREVSSALFLYGPNTRTMSVLFFDLTEGGNFEQLAALGVILLCTTLVFVGIGLLSLGRDFMLREGGTELSSSPYAMSGRTSGAPRRSATSPSTSPPARSCPSSAPPAAGRRRCSG